MDLEVLGSEQVLGYMDACAVHGGFCLDSDVHAATARRERAVRELAMESNRRLAGLDFRPATASATVPMRKRAKSLRRHAAKA